MWLITICREVDSFAAGAICLATKNASTCVQVTLSGRGWPAVDHLHRGQRAARLGKPPLLVIGRHYGGRPASGRYHQSTKTPRLGPGAFHATFDWGMIRTCDLRISKHESRTKSSTSRKTRHGFGYRRRNVIHPQASIESLKDKIFPRI